MKLDPASRSVTVPEPEVSTPIIQAPCYHLEARGRMPLHVHDDEAILVYAPQGAYSLFTEREVWLASPQCAVWIPPGQPSGMNARNQPVSLRPLHFPVPIPPALPRSTCMVQVRPLLASLIEELGRLTRTGALSARAEAVRLLILHEIVDAAVSPFQMPLPKRQSLRRAALAFLDDLGSSAPTAHFAKLAGMSLRSFHRHFTVETAGLSWNAWAAQVRLIAARQMIEAGERIGQASLAVGYESPSAFAAAFRRQFGLPPRTFALKLSRCSS